MNFTLKIWRQKDAKAKGGFETYKVENISADTSFLEMLDILNNNLIHEGKEPVAFDHDCREGICGMCSLHIDGHAHGPSQAVTTCQIYMRKFKDGATITIEPWRSAAFPVIKDLVVNRSSYDQILQAGGFISVRTNSVPDGNAIPIPKADADESMDAAACVGCGACAATCKNGSAMLFVAARVSSLAKLPRGGCTPRQGDGRQDGRTGLRQLHQHGCLPGRVPQVDLHRAHRTPEPRIPLGKIRGLNGQKYRSYRSTEIPGRQRGGTMQSLPFFIVSLCRLRFRFSICAPAIPGRHLAPMPDAGRQTVPFLRRRMKYKTAMPWKEL